MRYDPGQLDGDHGGELIFFGGRESGYTDEEQRLYNGRWAQFYAQFLPGSTRGPEDTWAWFWVSESTWYDQPEYMDMAYEFEVQPTGEDWLWTESSWTLWDDFIWNDPDASVQTDLEEGNIIGLGWMYRDVNDGGDLRFFIAARARHTISGEFGLGLSSGTGRRKLVGAFGASPTLALAKGWTTIRLSYGNPGGASRGLQVQSLPCRFHRMGTPWPLAVWTAQFGFGMSAPAHPRPPRRPYGHRH